MSPGEAEEAIATHELVAEVVQPGFVSFSAHVLDEHHGEGERVQQEHHEHVHHRAGLTVCAVRSPWLLCKHGTWRWNGTSAIEVMGPIVAPLQRCDADGRAVAVTGRSIGRSQAAR